jgi:hypothetical protein
MRAGHNPAGAAKDGLEGACAERVIMDLADFGFGLFGRQHRAPPDGGEGYFWTLRAKRQDFVGWND